MLSLAIAEVWCIVQFLCAKPSLGSAIPTRVSSERQHCTVSLHLDSSWTFYILIALVTTQNFGEMPTSWYALEPISWDSYLRHK